MNRALLFAVLLLPALISSSMENPREEYSGELPAGKSKRFSILLNPNWKFLILEGRVKGTGLVPGKEGWQCARIRTCFLDGQKKRIGKWPELIRVPDSGKGLNFRKIFDIPKNAVEAEILACNFGTAGSATFQAIKWNFCESGKEIAEATEPSGKGTKEIWNLNNAFRLTNEKREDVCLNGLWQFNPILDGKELGWGWFKVPGSWPNINKWNQPGNVQEIYGIPYRPWEKLRKARCRRIVKIPKEWNGREIFLNLDMPQTSAEVRVNQKNCGTLKFPGGTLNLTGKVIPGEKADLDILVSADPRSAEQEQFMAAGRVIKIQDALPHRGLTGDVFLRSRPAGGRIEYVGIETSVRRKQIQFNTELSDVPQGIYSLEAAVLEQGKEIRRFSLKNFRHTGGYGKYTVAGEWDSPKLWTPEHPEHRYTAVLSLKSADGRSLDQTFPEEFGFREISVRGRDILLNGNPLTMRSLCYVNRGLGANGTSVAAIQRMVEHVKKLNGNHLIPDIYSVAPGYNGYLRSFYEITSRNGIMTSFTLPHASSFQWKLDLPEQRKRYRELSEYFIRRYRNIPGIIFYAMNHNATGCRGDQNPLVMGGKMFSENELEKENPGQVKLRKQAEIAAKIARSLDKTRIVYHHSSGPLSGIYTLNSYLNWVPAQERADWFEHWEKEGTIPMFLIEYGIPFYFNWSSFRPTTPYSKRCLWLSEYNAAETGENAYRDSTLRQWAYRYQNQRSGTDKENDFWPYVYAAADDPESDLVRERMVRDVLFSFRVRGISVLPWDGELMMTRPNARKESKTVDYPGKFKGLKHPGPVPDRLRRYSDFMRDCGSFELTRYGRAIRDVYRPILCRIAGSEESFTEKSHGFRPGEKFRKVLMILNGTSSEETIHYRWSVPELQREDSGRVVVPAGERKEISVALEIPRKYCGKLSLSACFQDRNGKSEDRLEAEVIPLTVKTITGKIGIFDPEGSTEQRLQKVGLPYRKLLTEKDLNRIDLLIFGRNALDKHTFSVPSRLKVLVMEQSEERLKKMGFRTNIYGLRNVFAQNGKIYRDWRGSATSVPPYFEQEKLDRYPIRKWDLFQHPRAWRAGCRGSVATILPEKPQRGDFLPILRGGFDLQYAPVLKADGGRILFCQMDVSGRTIDDPEAENLFFELLYELDSARKTKPRTLEFQGNPEQKNYFEKAGFRFNGTELLVLTRGANIENLLPRVQNGLRVLTVGLNGNELEKAFPGLFKTESGTWYPDLAEGLEKIPEFAGISSADLNFRSARTFDAFAKNNPGGRILACKKYGKGIVTALSVPPWEISGEFQFRTVHRNMNYLVSRLLCNLGAKQETNLEGLLNPDFVNLPVHELGPWRGKADPGNKGIQEKWFEDSFRPDSDWRPVKTGLPFEDQFTELKNYDGKFWYRTEFEWNGGNEENLLFNFGLIDDESWIWINGKMIGELSKKTNPKNYWSTERRYRVPSSILRTGKNNITVLCNDLFMKGGILGHPEILGEEKTPFYFDRPIGQDDPYRYYRW